MVDKLMFCTN